MGELWVTIVSLPGVRRHGASASLLLLHPACIASEYILLYVSYGVATKNASVKLEMSFDSDFCRRRRVLINVWWMIRVI